MFKTTVGTVALLCQLLFDRWYEIWKVVIVNDCFINVDSTSRTLLHKTFKDAIHVAVDFVAQQHFACV